MRSTPEPSIRDRPSRLSGHPVLRAERLQRRLVVPRRVTVAAVAVAERVPGVLLSLAHPLVGLDPLHGRAPGRGAHAGSHAAQGVVRVAAPAHAAHAAHGHAPAAAHSHAAHEVEEALQEVRGVLRRVVLGLAVYHFRVGVHLPELLPRLGLPLARLDVLHQLLSFVRLEPGTGLELRDETLDEGQVVPVRVADAVAVRLAVGMPLLFGNGIRALHLLQHIHHGRRRRGPSEAEGCKSGRGVKLVYGSEPS
mmetsp:Transcript_47472/g.135828  ORF Transcript_47472/g.135828 Transcript_47472/m.135828 type:complete len:251 (-) Transcript_47472:23-775(-)